jgi:hypothetical protein
MMRIATAVQEESEVCVYDAAGCKLFSKKGELYCYSSNVVVVEGNEERNLNSLYVYDDTGYMLCIRTHKCKPTAEQILEEYKYVVGGERAREELERLRAIARHNEASALAHAERKGERRERELWQGVVAEKDALIAKLMAQLGGDKA